MTTNQTITIIGQVVAQPEDKFNDNKHFLTKCEMSSENMGNIKCDLYIDKPPTLAAIAQEIKNDWESYQSGVDNRRFWKITYEPKIKQKNGETYTNNEVKHAQTVSAPSAPNPAPTPAPVTKAPQAPPNDQRSDIRRAVAFKGAIDAAPSLEDIRRSLAGITEDKTRLTQASIFKLADTVSLLTDAFDLILLRQFMAGSEDA
jgi:hypothetical protein